MKTITVDVYFNEGPIESLTYDVDMTLEEYKDFMCKTTLERQEMLKVNDITISGHKGNMASHTVYPCCKTEFDMRTCVFCDVLSYRDCQIAREHLAPLIKAMEAERR